VHATLQHPRVIQVSAVFLRMAASPNSPTVHPQLDKLAELSQYGFSESEEPPAYLEECCFIGILKKRPQDRIRFLSTPGFFGYL
jgi:hypothetical protein